MIIRNEQLLIVWDYWEAEQKWETIQRRTTMEKNAKAEGAEKNSKLRVYGNKKKKKKTLLKS